MGERSNPTDKKYWIVGDTPGERSHNRRTLIALGGALATLVGCIGLTAKVSIEDEAHRNEVEIPQVQAAVVKDGMTVARNRQTNDLQVGRINVSSYAPPTVDVTLDLGNCEIPVNALVELSETGDITDVHGYSFDGYTQPAVVADSDRRGNLTDNFYRHIGEPITFQFDDLAGLQADFDTDRLCAAMGESYAPDTTVPR